MSRRVSMLLCLFLSTVACAEPPADKSDPVDVRGDRLPPNALARLGTTRVRSAVWAVAFAPDGKTLWSAEVDGRLCKWDIATGRQLEQVELRGNEPFPRGVLIARYPMFSPDGRHVLGAADGLRLWELPTGKTVCDLDGYRAGPPPVAFSPDGALLAIGIVPVRPESKAAPVRLWDVVGRRMVRELRGLRGEIRHVVFSNDGKRVAASVAGVDGLGGGPVAEIAVWETATGKMTASIRQKRVGMTPWLAFTPNGTLLAVAGLDRAVRLFEAVGGEEARALPVDRNSTFVVRAIFSPDGRTLAAVVPVDGRDGRTVGMRVSLLEVATGRVRWELGGDKGSITALAFSRDGGLLATGGEDITVLLWDLSGQLRPDREPVGGRKWVAEAWEELDSSDAMEAFRAVQRLALSPGEALSLLKKHLAPAGTNDVTEETIGKLIEDLDADEFAVREDASEKLAKVGVKALDALEQALKNDPPVETKARIQRLLEKLTPNALDKAKVRPTRALEVLERIGTPEARKIVETLAAGKAGVALTEEAKATLARMKPKD